MLPVYEWLLDTAPSEAPVERVFLGLNWTLAEVAGAQGFSFSPRQVPRTLPWAGDLRGQGSDGLRRWLLSWDPAEAAVGLAVLNACVNAGSACAAAAQPLDNLAPPHLRVFAHFRAQLEGRRVAVIGRYPGLDKLWDGLAYHCLERNPQDGDLPDSACEFILPQMDWVFITASSLANKSLPRLLELSRDAQVVLMGPSLPWHQDWEQFGVNYLAGVRVQDAEAVRQVVAEGGGTRLFTGPVQYALARLA